MVVVVVVALGACRHADGQTACKARVAELKSYLVQVLDPAAKVAPPWPTGEPETDRVVDEARANLRKVMAETSEDKARPLLPPRTDGPVDVELARCPLARDAWASLPELEGPDRMTRWANAIGDGIAACGCQIDIPLIRSQVYLMTRGPD